MKVRWMVVVTLLVAYSMLYAGSPAFKVRNAEFGMPIKQVMKGEKEKLLEKGDDYLFYATTLNNNDYRLIYNFVDNKLYRVAYSLVQTFVNQNNYIEAYKDMKEKLLGKYGEPVSDDEDWSNDLYKDDPEQYGLAVSMGHLSYTAKWATNDIAIYLTLSGEEFKVSSYIIYFETNLAKIAEERQSKAEEDNY